MVVVVAAAKGGRGARLPPELDHGRDRAAPRAAHAVRAAAAALVAAAGGVDESAQEARDGAVCDGRAARAGTGGEVVDGRREVEEGRRRRRGRRRRVAEREAGVGGGAAGVA